MASKKSTEKATTTEPPVKTQGPVMCAISKDNIQALYDWLNSDAMTMPQNQVRMCISLLNEATLIED